MMVNADKAAQASGGIEANRRVCSNRLGGSEITFSPLNGRAAGINAYQKAAWRLSMANNARTFERERR